MYCQFVDEFGQDCLWIYVWFEIEFGLFVGVVYLSDVGQLWQKRIVVVVVEQDVVIFGCFYFGEWFIDYFVVMVDQCDEVVELFCLLYDVG